MVAVNLWMFMVDARYNKGWRWALCSALILSVPASLFAGEKIKFSDGPDSVLSPAPSSGKDGLDFLRRFDFKTPNFDSGGAMVPLLPPPPVQLDPATERKLLEILDKKKNWMLENPAEKDPDKVLKEIFGVRETSISGEEKKFKSVQERFFEEGRTGNNSDPNLIRNRRNNRTGAEDDRAFPNQLERGSAEITSPASIPELNMNRLLDQGRANEPLALPRSDFGVRSLRPETGMQNDSGSFNRSRENERPTGIDHLFTPGRSLADGLRDPIHLQKDSTRQAINPIVGEISSSSRRFDLPRAIGPGESLGATRSGLADQIGPRGGFTDSSFTPAAVAPAPAPLLQPRPGVLEIPRRVF
jgi:hypothetical protein